jgi:HK97 gp10 family phage protein
MNIGFKILENTALPKLERFPGEVQHEIKTAFPEIGSYVLARTQVLTPVRSGNLKRSEDYRVAETTVIVYADMPYARFVEFGTRKMAARPYLRPALMQSQPWIENRIRAAVMRALLR